MKNKRGGVIEDFSSFLKDSLKDINPKDNFVGFFDNWKSDVMAGITVAFIALPLALAFGVGSGLGALSGLWGAIAGGLLGSILGGSRIGVSGPTGPKMAQLAVIMVGYTMLDGSPDIVYAFSIIFLSGLILVALSLLRVGKLIYYTPYSVIAGFMCGIGVLVIILELDPLLGLPNAKSVMDVIKTLPTAISSFKPHSLELSLGTLALLFAYPKLTRGLPVLSKIPSTLAVLVLGTIIANVFALNVDFIGHIPMGFPKIMTPNFGKYTFGQYFFPALSLAGLAIFDSLLTCLVNDNLSGDKHNSNRELFGQGVANMGAGLFGGLTTATATMRSVALYKSGGRGPLASFVHGIVLLSIAVFLGPIAGKIPLPCLAAILMKVGIDIIDYRVLPLVHRLPFSDLIVFLTVFVVTVVEDLLIAMGIGMALACFRFVQEISRVYKIEVDENVKSSMSVTDENIKVFAPKGPLFFGAVKSMQDAFSSIEEGSKVKIDLSQVVMIDLSGAFALDDAIESLKERKVSFEIIYPEESVTQVLVDLELFHKWSNLMKESKLVSAS